MSPYFFFSSPFVKSVLSIELKYNLTTLQSLHFIFLSYVCRLTSRTIFHSFYLFIYFIFIRFRTRNTDSRKAFFYGLRWRMKVSGFENFCTILTLESHKYYEDVKKVFILIFFNNTRDTTQKISINWKPIHRVVSLRVKKFHTTRWRLVFFYFIVSRALRSIWLSSRCLSLSLQ